MKILLLGANGQVGWELQRSLSPLGQLRPCDRSAVDLTDLDSLSRLLRSERPDIIVNAAAYTAVDRAESEVERARRVNAEAVAVLASAASDSGAWLVHYSTDYVFDGTKNGPYDEGDAPAPLSIYGRTKLEGERAITASGCRHLIFRTSWVYSARGSNFARTMLRLATEKDELNVVADQTGAPTSAELIADVTALAISRLHHDRDLADRATGTYHLVPQGVTSWHGYASFLLKQAWAMGAPGLRTTPDKVLPIASADYPLAARRPANSRLAVGKLQEVFGLKLPPWQDHVVRLVREIANAEVGAL